MRKARWHADLWLWASVVAGLLGVLAHSVVLASTAAPHDYYVLSPEPLTGPLSVMSLEPGNVINVGSYSVTLKQYESISIPATAFTSGSKLSGTGFFTVGSSANAADLLVPDDFAGTQFVIPHIAGNHRYFFLSPAGTANVTVQIGANSYNVTANQGVVNEFDAGSDNSQAGRITSDAPIVLTHVAYVSGAAQDAYPVPPAVNDVIGVRSQNTILAALNSGTTVMVYASDGTSSSHSLSAGQQITLSVGSGATQGQGSALHIVANAPVAAVQYDDGDGADATAFWASTHFGRRHGLPVNTQYVAVACDQASVTLTLYKGASAPEVQSCSGSSTTPGKAYFGVNTSGANLSAGWYLISSSPVYAAYEAATPEDEHNLLGLTPVAGPTAPTLNAIASPTTNNPQSVSGTAGANQAVRLYVNGLLQATATANGSGAYTFSAALIDGTNTLYATAVTGSNESDPSNAVSIDYNNTIPRSQSGSISGTVVWTPGNPATPYTITAADLTIPTGSQLILQPGTQVRFGSGRRMTVNGTLTVSGTAGANVVFTSNLASPTRGSWVGIVISSTASNVLIERAQVEWAQSGINVSGAAVVLRYNTIRNFSADGILMVGAGANGSVIQGNLIDNLNDTVDCLEVLDASPQIIGNTLTNCSFGLHVNRSSSPTVNGNNIITSNAYGIQIYGNNVTPQPVINGNQIYANTSNSIRAYAFITGAQDERINATGNWWGTADATAISSSISDLTDSYNATDRPNVDFGSFLGSAGGAAVPGNFLIGPFSGAATTLSAVTYDVIGMLFVRAGRTLSIPSGATLRFHARTGIIVDGSITVQGTSTSPTMFTSGRATPAYGDWDGIYLRSGSGSVIEYAQVERTTTAIGVYTAATVRNSTLRYFNADGILVVGAGATASVIQGNLIDNLNDTVDCLEMLDASPQILDNTLRNCNLGLHVNRSSSPTVTGNIITSNAYGVQIYGNNVTPQPVITGNQITANTTASIRAYAFASGAQNVRIDATGNWWGTTDATAISLSISDLTDSYNATDRPTVDFGNFLDGANGSPVSGNYLIGSLPAASTTLNATTYDVIGMVFVRAGRSLTVPAGSTLRFHARSGIIVDGSIAIQGTSTSPAVFTSGRATQAAGDWDGISLRSGTGSLVEYAQVERTTTGIGVFTAATVRNNTIRYFNVDGIHVNGAAASSSVIQNNLIDNINDTADGMEIVDSSPAITGNTVTNCNRAIVVWKNAHPSISSNIVTSSALGFEIAGNSNQTPLPVITGNQIFANGINARLDLYAGGAQNVRVNGTGNWWGTADATAISVSIQDITDEYTATDRPTLDFSNFLDSPGGSPMPGNYLIGPLATSTTLTAGATYQVLGLILVGTGTNLTIPAGTTLRFHGPSFIVVDGSITLQGTSVSPVILTSGRSVVARGDWRGVYVRAGSGSLIEYGQFDYATTSINVSNVAATVRYNTIRNFLNNGVYIGSTGTSGTLVQGNVIDNLNDTVNCIEANGSSPTLSGNTLTNCLKGISIIGGSNGTIVNGNNIITGNDYGIYVDGTGGYLPGPMATGNQIFGNDIYNYFTNNFGANAASLVRNATSNWWGSTDVTTIAAGIFDITDEYTATDLPTVNFASFLDGPNGSPVAGNYLIGPVSGTTALSAGTTYDVLGLMMVTTGANLTIPAGVTLRFHGPSFITVDGSIVIQGTSVNPVILTSGRATPARGDWRGVFVRAGSGSLIEYAQIDYATTSINVSNVVGTVRNNTISNFANNGVYVSGVGANGTLVQNNTIDNLNDTANCIEVNGGSPTLSGNLLTNCLKGISIVGGSNSTVINGNNIVTSNDYGIYVDATGNFAPGPVVTGNQLFANDVHNYVLSNYGPAGAGSTRNATGNWWGSVDPAVINSRIVDQHDSYGSNLPVVDYSNFLDGPNGSPVAQNHLVGILSAASTTLTAGATYEVLGLLTVPSGKTLTIPAGTLLRFHQPNARLIVNGTLSVQGTANSKVRLTSAKADPIRGDWYGIEITATATGVVIDHADIEWTTRAVSVTGTNATISNSLIHNFTENGIRMTNATAGSQIASNYIDNYDSTGTGIYLSASSPAITGNKIYRTSIGIFAIGASNPSITGNAISNNGRGIVLDGNNSNSASAVPNPVITGNDIFGNAGAQLEVYRYGATNPVVINATGNWWGTATPAAGQQILFTGGSPTTKADFSNPSTASQTGPVGGNVILSEYYFSPNSDAIKDTTTVSGTLNQSASWTVTIRNSGYSTVRSFSGSGTTISAIWDGRDNGGNVLPDATYSIQVEASGGSGSATIGARVATLDTTAPATAITTPSASAMLSNVLQIPVLGSASDGYLVNFTLDYGAGASPATWTTLTSQAASINASTLGTWVVSSTVGGAALGSGPYVLRLRTSDKAGNTGLLQIPVTLELMSITNVTHNTLRVIQPLLGEQFQVNFTLPAPATASLRIYPETGGALIKEIAQVFTSGGAKSLNWDGRNSAGAYVPEEAYSYVLYADDGARNAIYDPPAPGGDGSGSGTVDASFNANKNDFWKMNYTMNHYGRIRMQVSGCTSPTHFPYNWVPYPSGTHPLIWDGRGADGQTVSGTCAIYFDPPLYMKSNSVIVRGTTPKVTGTGASPSIEVKSNPYRITHSYEHISKITYRVDQDSYVTVKLLPPGISDPASPQAIVITNNELTYAQSGGQPADHVVEWKGYEDVDTNNILVSEEGSYTFAIQATGVTTGRTALYRGALQLWQ